MSDVRRFAKLHHDTFSGPVWEDMDDDAHRAAVTRLLMAADRAYPELPDIPRLVPDDILEDLERAGLVKRHPRDRFEWVGLIEDRRAAADHAKVAAAGRWNGNGNGREPDAPSIAPSTARRNATRQDETRQDETRRIRTTVP
jgi:hypothetical protein